MHCIFFNWGGGRNIGNVESNIEIVNDKISTHTEFAHMCSNNSCPFNLNYVTEMLYLLTLSITNTL